MKLIGETASLAGVSGWTLRYYDRVGLLKPRARSDAGYRLYGREEFLRLREILVWRSLGFPVADIAALMDDPAHDRVEALRRQRSIAGLQLDKFRSITRGLDVAIAASDTGGSLADDDVFEGFPPSLFEEEDTESVMDRPNVVRVPHARTSTPLSATPEPSQAERATPMRIAATDPIRIGENLLALGIVPVGAGTYWDPLTKREFCPWPDLIEAPIRDRVQGLGYYGTEKDLVARARPDLIFDLLFTRTGAIGCEDHSLYKTGNKCRHEDLCKIAPTVLLDAPIATPGFVGRLKHLATVLSLGDRVDPLIASWEARTRVLREHISGQTVSAFNANAVLVEVETINCGVVVGVSPNLHHEAQLFSTLGLELLPPPEGRPAQWGGAVLVTAGNARQLTAPTLFLTVDHGPWPEQFQRLVRSQPLAELPALRSGRVFDLRWFNTRSGWFSAHCQLEVIARAFGVWRLRTSSWTSPVHLAVKPSGRVTVSPTAGDGIARLCGPRISDVRLELVGGAVTEVDVGDAAGHLSTFPEAYSLITDSEGERQLMPDRESALERVTQRYAA